MKQYIMPKAPQGMILNPDHKVVNIVIENLATRTDGFCPRFYFNEMKELSSKANYKCPCKEVRETKICKCKLFV